MLTQIALVLCILVINTICSAYSSFFISLRTNFMWPASVVASLAKNGEGFG